MPRYSLSHLADHVLLRGLRALVSQDRLTTAAMLAHLAEVDARRLYLPAGYPSMYAWCVGELRFSEDAAWKRIQSARAARDFPAILDAVGDGRLHLSGVVLLAPHLTRENAAELLAAATHRSKREIERLLAERFPQPDVPTLVRAVQPITPALTTLEPAPGQVEVARACPAAAGEVSSPVAPPPVAPAPPARIAALAPQRFALQVTLAQATHDKLRRAQELLAHVVAPNDVAAVLDRALDELVAKLERRKCGAAKRPRTQLVRGREDLRQALHGCAARVGRPRRTRRATRPRPG